MKDAWFGYVQDAMTETPVPATAPSLLAQRQRLGVSRGESREGSKASTIRNMTLMINRGFNSHPVRIEKTHRRGVSPNRVTVGDRMAGYSGTPLTTKLGIGARTTLLLVNAPPHLADSLDTSGRGHSDGDKGTSAVVVIFATEAADLERRFLEAMATLPADGAIWCSWPKRASKVPTDITEDRLRDLFLPTGMVDNKVAAIDEIWSGLRFVVRRELRAGWNS